DFYTVRVLASEHGALGAAAQGPLEQARQQIIAEAVAKVQSGNPGVPVTQTGGGFDKPVQITIGTGAAPAAAGGGGPGGPPSAPPPSSTQPAPPSSTQPAP